MTNTDPGRVCVVVPNYNHAAFVGEALEALLTQSLSPAKIVVVDDASTDNSLEVLGEIARRNPMVQVIQNSVNTRSAAFCRRVAETIADTSYDYIYLNAADDRVLPGFLQKAVALLTAHPAAGMCAGLPRYMDARGKRLDNDRLFAFHSRISDVGIRKPVYVRPAELTAYLKRYPWLIGGFAPVLFRRSALAGVGIIHELGQLADWFTVHHVAFEHGICYLPEHVVQFRVMTGGQAGVVARNPAVALEQHTRALVRMQEPPYSHIFPADFVEAKRREFTYTSIRGALVFWRYEFLRELARLVPPCSPVGRLLMAALVGSLWGVQALLKLYCRMTMAPSLRATLPAGSQVAVSETQEG